MAANLYDRYHIYICFFSSILRSRGGWGGGYNSDTRQHAAHATNKLSSPSCSTRTIPKTTTTPWRNILKIFLGSGREDGRETKGGGGGVESQESWPLAEEKNDKTERAIGLRKEQERKQKSAIKWQLWDSGRRRDLRHPRPSFGARITVWNTRNTQKQINFDTNYSRFPTGPACPPYQLVIRTFFPFCSTVQTVGPVDVLTNLAPVFLFCFVFLILFHLNKFLNSCLNHTHTMMENIILTSLLI